MRRLIPVLAALVLAVMALPAGAYQLLSQHAAVSGVQPERWQSLPVSVTVDQGPQGFADEVKTALKTWNDVPTARDPFATPSASGVDFDETNLGTAWGDLSGDGRQEVVYDATGRAIQALGFAPAAVNGYGPRHELVRNGQAVIDDMFLVIVGSHSDFDRASTEVHELGHTIGLAHSSTGWAEGKDGSLSPLLSQQLPTMHPFAAGPDRRTLEIDDRAALSELYPEPSLTTSTGSVQGQVVRCGTNNPVSGAQVRLISAGNIGDQISRVTGFDGDVNGLYTINGVPEGDYFAVVEPLAGDDEMFDRLALFTNVETDFTQEYFNTTEGCGADDDDTEERQTIHVGPGGSATVNFNVESAGLALVIDTTNSMGPELEAAKVALNTMVTALQAVPGDFPKTALVTFRDDARVDIVTSDADKLKQKIAGLTRTGTTDCPEESNRALLTAGRLLGSGGRAILVTDAESRPTGPSRRSVEDLYASKGIQLSTLLSDDTCRAAPAPRPARAFAAPAPVTPAGDGAAPEVPRPADELGIETPIVTFGEESLVTGGLFSFQKEIKGQNATVPTRFSNTLANLALAAVRPVVTAVEPGSAPRGATLTVELTGDGTSFGPASTVAVSGTGVQVTGTDVQSPSRIVATLTVDANADLGFRDVTVTTGSATATGLGALQVAAAPTTPTLLSVTPAAITAGTTRDVTISGGATSFTGASQPGFGADVTVDHVSVASATSLTATIRAAAGAAPGLRTVTVRTGGETATLSGPFLVKAPSPPPPVTSAVPRLTGASPGAGARGTTVEVELTGADTAFVQGPSVAGVSGSGVDVLSTRVVSPTEAFARLRIAADAPLGLRDLRISSGTATPVLRDSFQVVPAPVPAPQPGPQQPSTCRDSARPTASYASVSVKRRELSARGRARDAGCTADISVAGRVARVELAISRKAGKRCRFASARGRLGTARACSRPVWLKAKGTTRWSLAVKLPRGRYTLLLRARDGAGNLTARPAKRSVRVR